MKVLIGINVLLSLSERHESFSMPTYFQPGEWTDYSILFDLARLLLFSGKCY